MPKMTTDYATHEAVKLALALEDSLGATWACPSKEQWVKLLRTCLKLYQIAEAAKRLLEPLEGVGEAREPNPDRFARLGQAWPLPGDPGKSTPSPTR